MTLLDSALALARAGLPVFPLVERGKEPRIPSAHPDGDPVRGKCAGACGKEGHGFHDAAKNEATIRAWWARWPDANLGVPTGAVSGLDVLDLDAPKGVASLAGLEAVHGEVPRTLTVRTGGGGLHLYFLHAEGLRNRAGVAEGIDVRGDGGYVVVPPSIHPSGRRYEALHGANADLTEFANWPSWLLALVVKPRPEAGGGAAGAPARPAPGGGTPYGQAALAGLVEELRRIEPGRRDDVRNAIVYRAGRLVAGGHVDRAEAEEALDGACVENGLADDLGEREVRDRIRRGIEDGIAAGPAGPRKEPPMGPTADSANTAKVSDNGWPTPHPLAARRVPEFPVDALPGWTAEWVEAEAEATQTPPALAGCVALGVLSTAAARAPFRVRAADGWEEPTNLYVVVSLPPANLKSPVFAAGTRPLVEWEADVAKRHGPAIAKAQAAYDLVVKRLDAAQRKAAKAEGDKRAEAERDALALAGELAGRRRPNLPRLFAQDVTPERLGALMEEQAGAFALLGAEGGIFETLAGRYSDGVLNIDLLLSAHAGEPVRVDRGSREPVSLDAPSLVVVLAVQPDVIDGLARKPGFRGRGLLARFAYAVPESLLGRRRIPAPPVPADVAEAYSTRVRTLLDLGPDTAKGDPHAGAPVVLVFDAEARERMTALRRAIEPRLAPGGDLAAIGDWAGKYPGLVARLAGLIHVGEGAHEVTALVTARTMERAEKIGRFFLDHALAAFDAMGADPATEGARHVLSWLRRKAVARIDRRTLFEGVKGGATLRTVPELDAALVVLVEAGWLRPVAVEPRSGPGRAPSPQYDVHTSLAFAKSAEREAPGDSANTASGGVGIES